MLVFAECMLRCRLACIVPPSLLDPRLVSGAFAVAKDEGRDRFIGDRRPLNCRESGAGRAHLPYCPRLRRISRFLPHAWRNSSSTPPELARTLDESLDVMDTAVESSVSQDLLKTRASVEPVSELDYFQIGPVPRSKVLTADSCSLGQRAPLPAHKDDWRRFH